MASIKEIFFVEKLLLLLSYDHFAEKVWANNSFLAAISCCEHYFMRTRDKSGQVWQLIVRSTTLYNRACNHTGWQTSNRQQMDGYAWTKRRIVARANSVDFQLVHRESVCLFNRKRGCTYRRVVPYPLRTLAPDGFYIRSIKRGSKQGR